MEMTALRHLLFRRASQVLIDVFILVAAWVAAYVLRFEGLPSGTQQRYLTQMVIFLPIIVFARLILFYAFSVYKIIWR
jgi:FlaA1/EpsC-like NDP-sugar epimerase